jgi:hypothetical protein
MSMFRKPIVMGLVLIGMSITPSITAYAEQRVLDKVACGEAVRVRDQLTGQVPRQEYASCLRFAEDHIRRIAPTRTYNITVQVESAQGISSPQQLGTDIVNCVFLFRKVCSAQ